jgi:hypothetical protein
MSDSCKYRVLNHRYIIEENYKSKRRENDRPFLHSWLKDNDWLVNTKKLEGAFCKYCVLFSTVREKRIFINEPKLKKWKHATTEFKNHVVSSTHKDCIKLIISFKHMKIKLIQ